MLDEFIKCFKEERYLYSQHARTEMEAEEFGEIKDQEVFEAVLRGKNIESYTEDKPYQSYLIYRRTAEARPIHIVCAYAEDINKVIIITGYQPRLDQWIDFERRIK
jgi:hypothetical protein